MPRIEQQVFIKNRLGLHARAAIKLVELAQSFENTTITLKNGDKEALVEGVMGILMLESAQGEQVTVIAEGSHAQQALTAVCDLILAGFNEDD
ncbi:HPr family phosphocarrier protein [Thaumasiovibrio subtropicus]|uniref:HPr family phosphocarrier protein n=1 Tax=Thaumasiovibrio subtropicus TaxID=1891207 RepID=UPI000B3551D9|nr:HPr family phosphocarrier protein [Thaumasiovibrio subtropicus]